MTTMVMRLKDITSKGWKALYWASTIFTTLALGASGTADLARVPDIAEGIARLGYPAYFPMILGIWKLFGSVAIMVPGLVRLKQWAYAGIFFLLTGAATSHAVVGDPAGKILVPLTLLAVAMISWTLQPARGIGYQNHAGMQRAAARFVMVDIDAYNR